MLNLDFTAGRLLPPFEHRAAGDLTEADIGVLLTRAPRIRTSLVRLTERHHAMARAIAGGTSHAEVALTFNYAYDTVGIIAMDPAFKNLVDFYSKSEEIGEYRSTQARLGRVTNSSLDLLEDKLDDPAIRAAITPLQLVEIAKFGADRSGNGPMSSSVNVSVNSNLADRMKVAREQARAASGVTIDGKANYEDSGKPQSNREDSGKPSSSYEDSANPRPNPSSGYEDSPRPEPRPEPRPSPDVDQ